MCEFHSGLSSCECCSCFMPFLSGLAEALKSTVLSSPCHTDGNDGSNLIQMSKNGLSVSMASLFSGTLQCSPGHTCVCVLCVCVHGHISLKSAWFQNWELVPVPSRCQQEKLWQDDVAGWSRAEAEEFCCGLHPPGHFAVQYFGCIKSACCGQDLSCLE